MTNQELLIPRYKVIAGYPHSPYKTGDIITLKGKTFHLSTTPYKSDFGTFGSDNYFPNDDIKNYPKLFREMWWSDERKIEDLPKYLRVYPDGDVNEVLEWKYETEYGYQNVYWKCRVNGWSCIENFKPATEQEFNEQNKNK